MSPGHGRAEIREGDLVAAALPNGELVEIMRACWDAGAALLPIDPRLPAPARNELVEAAAPTLLMEEGSWTRVPGEPAGGADAVVIATSGTSGRPRLVVLQRDAVTAAVRASAARLELRGGDRWLLCIPAWHVGGMLVVLRHLLLGAPLTVDDGADLGAAVDALDIRYASLVPTQVRRLSQTGLRFDHLRAVLVGGDALDPAVRTAALAASMPIVHTYGQSQSCGGVVYDGVPLGGVEVSISDDDEVLVAGPTLMSGYRRDEAATRLAFDGGGRLRTGDTGFIDAGGRLVVTGRLDDVIVTGGEKVVPQTVERVLSSVAGVADVAVVGEPDDEWGSRVVAVVVPSDEATVTLDALRDAARAALPAHCAPKRLVTMRVLPRTESGKVRRAALRDSLLSG